MILDITFEEKNSVFDMGLDPTTEYASKLLEKVKADNDETEAAIKEAAEMVVDAAERVEKVSVDKGTVANALKGTASGEVVRVDDVSPIEHTVKANVYGKNLFDISKIPTNSALTNNGDGSITIAANTYALQLEQRLCQLCPTLKGGDTVTFNLLTTSEIGKRLYITSTKTMWNAGTSRKITNEELNSRITLYGIHPDEPDYGKECIISNIQIELGDTATEYTPYIDPTTVAVTRYGADENDNPQTYTPSADGTCEIASVSPTMTLITDTPGVNIDLEYNQDTNKAMDAVRTDWKELDRVTAEIIANIGDVETLLGGI